MPKALDVKPGDVYGRLTVVACPEGTPRQIVCRCECGNEITTALQRLTLKKTKSCGCLRREMTIQKNTKHGLSSKTEYGIWTGIRKRCNNKKCKSYKDYGGRGIKLCERWQDFSLFLKDVGYRPSENLTIERIDVNGNYEPGNVKWATRAEQNRNNRNNRFIKIGNEVRCVSEWDSIFQFKYALRPQVFKSRFYRYGLAATVKWLAKQKEQIPLFPSGALSKAVEVVNPNINNRPIRKNVKANKIVQPNLFTQAEETELQITEADIA